MYAGAMSATNWRSLLDTVSQGYCIEKHTLFEQDQWRQNCLLVSKKTNNVHQGSSPWSDQSFFPQCKP